MTNSDTNHRLNPTIRRAIIVGGGAIGFVFLLGVLFGFVSAALEHGGLSGTAWAVAVAIAAALIAIVYCGWRYWPKSDDGPMATSERKSRNIYYASMVLGVVLGIFLVTTGGTEGDAVFSNGPISSTAAIGAILVWAIVVPLGTMWWLRTTDEHDRAAYLYGGNIAFHIYVFLVPSWWMATRAGWLPAQDPMIIWIGVAVIWSIGWLYRKYS